MTPEDDLERVAQRALERLPAPRAPHTLLPRVMAAVQQWTRRPWYARAWVTWPLGWQALSTAALVLLLIVPKAVGRRVSMRNDSFDSHIVGCQQRRDQLAWQVGGQIGE